MQELVVESLVVSLTMAMLDVLVDDEAQMPLAERDDTMEALFFDRPDERCFRHQLLLLRPYLVLTKPLRLDIQCQRGASVKIGWKYLDD